MIEAAQVAGNLSTIVDKPTNEAQVRPLTGLEPEQQREVEMSDPSKIPTLAEPWFLTFNANVEFRVVMTPDDLKKAGLDEIGKKWA